MRHQDGGGVVPIRFLWKYLRLMCLHSTSSSPYFVGKGGHTMQSGWLCVGVVWMCDVFCILLCSSCSPGTSVVVRFVER